MSDVVTALRAVANPDRLRILEVLLQGRAFGLAGLTITDVAREAEISRFSASRHLALLADAQLVRCTQLGNSRLHSLRIEAFERIEDWVIDFTCSRLGAGSPADVVE